MIVLIIVFGCGGYLGIYMFIGINLFILWIVVGEFMLNILFVIV